VHMVYDDVIEVMTPGEDDDDDDTVAVHRFPDKRAEKRAEEPVPAVDKEEEEEEAGSDVSNESYDTLTDLEVSTDLDTNDGDEFDDETGEPLEPKRNTSYGGSFVNPTSWLGVAASILPLPPNFLRSQGRVAEVPLPEVCPTRRRGKGAPRGAKAPAPR